MGYKHYINEAGFIIVVIEVNKIERSISQTWAIYISTDRDTKLVTLNGRILDKVAKSKSMSEYLLKLKFSFFNPYENWRRFRVYR